MSALETRNCLVVGGEKDFADVRYDGWIARHFEFVMALEQAGWDVCLQPLRIPGVSHELRSDLSSRCLAPIAIPVAVNSRLGRVAALAGREGDRHARLAYHRACEDAVSMARPRVVVTLGPWLEAEYEPFYSLVPSVYVYEEDIRRMKELSSQSRRARLLRRAEDAARRKKSLPTTVVVISEREVDPAQRRFGGRCRVANVNQTIPVRLWPRADSRSTGESVVCIGALNEERYGPDLAAFLDRMAKRQRPDRFKVVLVSGRGVHPDVRPFVGNGWVELRADIDDALPLYRTARISLVPSTRATGIKATILQAWSCGTPVAAVVGSARTVGPRHQAAMLVRGSPEDLADEVLSVWDRGERLDSLVESGWRALETDFDDADQLGRFVDLVASTASQGPQSTGARP